MEPNLPMRTLPWSILVLESWGEDNIYCNSSGEGEKQESTRASFSSILCFNFVIIVTIVPWYYCVLSNLSLDRLLPRTMTMMMMMWLSISCILFYCDSRLKQSISCHRRHRSHHCKHSLFSTAWRMLGPTPTEVRYVIEFVDTLLSTNNCRRLLFTLPHRMMKN